MRACVALNSRLCLIFHTGLLCQRGVFKGWVSQLTDRQTDSIFGERKISSYSHTPLHLKQKLKPHLLTVKIIQGLLALETRHTVASGELSQGEPHSPVFLSGKSTLSCLDTLFELKVMFKVGSDTTEQTVTVFCKTLVN